MSFSFTMRNRSRRLRIVAAVVCWFLLACGARAQVGVVNSSYEGSNLLRDVAGVDLSRSVVATEATVPYRLSRYEGYVRLRYATPNWRIQIVDPSADVQSNVPEGGVLSGTTDLQSECVSAELGIRNPSPDVAVSLRLQTSRDQTTELWLELLAQPSRNLEIGALRARVNVLPTSSLLYYTGPDQNGDIVRIGGRIHWLAPADLSSYRIALHPNRYITLAGRLRTANLSPDTASSRPIPTGDYLAVLEGDWRDAGFSARVQLHPDWILHAGYDEIDLESYLHGYLDGEKCAHFGEVNGQGSWLTAGVRNNDMSLRIASGSAVGQFNGTVDAWPFLDGLVSILGIQRHVTTDTARVDWRLVSASVVPLWRERYRLETRLDWLHLSPLARMRTWRQVFLGNDDVRVTEVDLQRADLLRLAVSQSVRVKRLAIAARVSQWIPLALRYRSEEQSAGGTPEPEGVGRTGSGWSGFSFALSIGAAF